MQVTAAGSKNCRASQPALEALTAALSPGGQVGTSCSGCAAPTPLLHTHTHTLQCIGYSPITSMHTAVPPPSPPQPRAIASTAVHRLLPHHFHVRRRPLLQPSRQAHAAPRLLSSRRARCSSTGRQLAAVLAALPPRHPHAAPPPRSGLQGHRLFPLALFAAIDRIKNRTD